MSKKPKSAPVLAWTTPETDFRRVVSWTAFDPDIFQHPAFTALNRTAALAYLMLATAARGKQEFSCPYTYAERCGISRSSYAAALDELAGAGFIRVSSGAATRQENAIRFVSEWKGRTPTKKKANRTPPPSKPD